MGFQMEDKDIEQLLQVKQVDAGRRGWRCPDETQLAAYVAQRLNVSPRNTLEAHLADCDFCLGQVAFLAQSADWTNLENVPAHLLRRAREVVARKSAKTINLGWRWAATAAALACFALLFVVVALRLRTQDSVSRPSDALVAQQTSPEPVISPPTAAASPPARLPGTLPGQAPPAKSSQTPTVRSVVAEGMLPKLITPRDGAMLRRENLEFRWQPVSDAIFYEVRVMSVEGDLVFEGQTETTNLKLDSITALVKGTKYFVRVRAHLRLGKAAESSVVSFRIAEQ